MKPAEMHEISNVCRALKLAGPQKLWLARGEAGCSISVVHAALKIICSQCPLSGVKRTWPIALQMSAYDPKRT